MKEPRASELEPQVPSPAACFRKSTWPRVEASCGEGVAKEFHLVFTTGGMQIISSTT